MRLKDILNEVPQAVQGDLVWDETQLRVKAEGFAKYWKIVGHLQTAFGSLDIAEGQHAWMVGAMRTRDDQPNRQEFRALIRIDGEPPNHQVPYQNPVITRFVYVPQNERVAGLASSLYTHLVDMGHTLIGDAEQYQGARRLWSRLSQQTGYAVDLLNVYTGTVLKRDVVLHQGQDELDFDPEVWSQDESKASIRPVLRKASAAQS